MELLRKFLWLWVIVGIIFASVLIAIIFVLINKFCITSRGKHRIRQLHRRSSFPVQSNKYQEGNHKSLTIPSLPPRTQFLTAEAKSYENLAEEPDYEKCDAEYEQDKVDYLQPEPDYEQDKADYMQPEPDYEQDKADYMQPEPDYEQDKADYMQPEPDYEQDKADYMQPEPDYEQDKADYVQPEPDYEQDKADYVQPEPDYELDYVKVEEDKITLPAPPYMAPHPAEDDDSGEDYDDIGGEETQDEEDYDDVG